MKTFAQILHNRVHWIFEAEEKPEFAPNIVLVEITDLKNKPRVGWRYEETTGQFSETPLFVVEDNQPTIEEMQAQTLLNTELLLIYKEIGM